MLCNPLLSCLLFTVVHIYCRMLQALLRCYNSVKNLLFMHLSILSVLNYFVIHILKSEPLKYFVIAQL